VAFRATLEAVYLAILDLADSKAQALMSKAKCLLWVTYRQQAIKSMMHTSSQQTAIFGYGMELLGTMRDK
jgi:hypothetical protein